jgi:hypothetical protein
VDQLSSRHHFSFISLAPLIPNDIHTANAVWPDGSNPQSGIANLHDPSILERFGNPVEPFVYGRDLMLQGIDLRARCRVEDADRRATG